MMTASIDLCLLSEMLDAGFEGVLDVQGADQQDMSCQGTSWFLSGIKQDTLGKQVHQICKRSAL